MNVPDKYIGVMVGLLSKKEGECDILNVPNSPPNLPEVKQISSCQQTKKQGHLSYNQYPLEFITPSFHLKKLDHTYR